MALNGDKVITLQQLFPDTESAEDIFQYIGIRRFPGNPADCLNSCPQRNGRQLPFSSIDQLCCFRQDCGCPVQLLLMPGINRDLRFPPILLLPDHGGKRIGQFLQSRPGHSGNPHRRECHQVYLLFLQIP